jgi:hypothetical protein
LSEDLKLQFSSWKKWEDRNFFGEILKYPGVYSLAISDHDLTGSNFSLIPEIVYFGMTNSQGGLKSRLRQFDNTIKDEKGEGHGGGVRVRRYMTDNSMDYKRISSHLFVAIFPIECAVNSNSPKDLRKMGRVANLEYECLAQYSEKSFKFKLPQFNDKKRSPK